jgi:hypothetical protein
MSPVPKNVENPELYQKIKAQIHLELKRKKKRWGIYASMMLVNRYKKAGGTYSDNEEYLKRKKNKNTTQLTGVDRWFAQKWINICQSKPPHHLVPCGSSQKNYPVCRPYIKVSSDTPLTYDQIDKSKIAQLCKKKNDSPLTKLPSFQSNQNRNNFYYNTVK